MTSRQASASRDFGRPSPSWKPSWLPAGSEPLDAATTHSADSTCCRFPNPSGLTFQVRPSVISSRLAERSQSRRPEIPGGMRLAIPAPVSPFVRTVQALATIEIIDADAPAVTGGRIAVRKLAAAFTKSSRLVANPVRNDHVDRHGRQRRWNSYEGLAGSKSVLVSGTSSCRSS